MTLAPAVAGEATAPAHHRRTFRIRNHDFADPVRTIDVHATPEQVRQLEQDGYLVRERLITGDVLQRLRDAADELAHAHGGAQAAGEGRFGGLFVRNLMDKHSTFRDVLLRFEPCLSVARALLGPQVQIHATVLRVTYADSEGQGEQQTHWHFHQRVVPDPVPAFFNRTHVIDNLIYLDDITEASGPLCVVPRTHLRDDDLPADDDSDKPGQVVLTVPAGSCVTAHSGLWHRAMPTRPGGGVRRLLILGYSPTWMKQVDRPGGGLTDELLPDADAETRELLGLAGYY